MLIGLTLIKSPSKIVADLCCTGARWLNFEKFHRGATIPSIFSLCTWFTRCIFSFFFRSILVKIDFEGWQQGIYSRSIFRQFTERVSNLWNIRYQ